MGDFDPVPWTVVEATIGPPAHDLRQYIDELQDRVRWKNPYDAVKTVHDALAEMDEDLSVSDLAEPFITAYLLEKNGVIIPGDEEEYRSIVNRRPSGEQLENLFRERKRTLWWIGILTGVHPSLVTFWLWEDDIPLLERNFNEDSMQKIRTHPEFEDG